MLSANRIKFIRSLHQKKYRQKYSQFLVEGLKTVQEFINQNWQIDEILVQQDSQVQLSGNQTLKISQVSKNQLDRISAHKTAPKVMAVVHIRADVEIDISKSIIALENINDPGNLGTIIRIADWYGINQILLSENTVDEYNAKVVSSTMGSLARVNLVRVKLNQALKTFNGTIYSALLEGKSIYDCKKGVVPFCLLIGSESHGISKELLNEINYEPISIPRIGEAESLNAGVATGILIDRLING